MHTAPRTNWYRLKQEQDRQELSQLESEYQKRLKNLEDMDDKRKIRVADKVKQQHSQAGASPGRQRAGTVGGTTTSSSSNKSWSSVVKDTPASTSGTSSTPSTPSTLRVEATSSPGRSSRAGGSSHSRQRSNGSASDSPGRTRGASPSRSSIQAGTVRKMQGSFNSPTGSPTSPSAPTTTPAAPSPSTASPSTSSTAKVSYAKAASSPTSENRTRLATRSVTTAAARSTSPSAASTSTTSYAPYAASAAPYSPASASAASTTRTRLARSPSTVSPAISAIASTFSGPNSAPSSARAAASPSSPTTSAPSSARASSPTPARSATTTNVRTPTSSPRTTTTTSTASPRPSITVTTASSPGSRSALASPTAVPASPSATRSRSVTSVVSSRPTSPPSVGSTPTASPRGPSPTIASTKKTSTPTVTSASSRTTAKSSASTSTPSSGTSSPAKSPTISRTTTAKSTSSASTTSSSSKLPTPGKVTLPAALLKGTKLEMRGSTLVHAHGEQVLVWNIAEQECILQFSGHSAPVHAVAVRGENVIVSASSAETLVWDAVTGKVLHSADGCTAMSAHPSLEQIIIATKPEGPAAPKLQILHLPSLTLLQSLDVNSAKGESLHALAWSSDTQLLLAVGSTVKHLDLKAKSFSASFTGHSGAILHIECFSTAKGSTAPTHFFSMCDQGQVLCFHLGSAKIVSKTASRGSCSTLFLLDDRNTQKLTSQLLPILIHPEGITTIAAKDDSIKMNDPDSALPIDVITASTPVLLL